MPEPEESSGLNFEQPPGLPDPSAFAPANPTDNRKPLDWQSKYPPAARREMWLEGIYLVGLLISVPLLMLLLWLGAPKDWLRLADQRYSPVLKYALAWLGGLLGGTLFSLKWLYHSFARQIWHQDRRPWRVFAPHISAGLAFAVVALVSSGIFRVFDSGAMNSKSLVVGVAFLVGYFSDSAVAKLTEIAETLFGASHGKQTHLETKKPAGVREATGAPASAKGSEPRD